MTHSFDTKVQFSGAGNPLTQALTLGSGATVLVLSIAYVLASTRTGTPTYNGANMTQVGTGPYNHATGEVKMEAWYILAPSTGASYNISIPNANAVTLYCHAYSFAAANSSVFDTFAMANTRNTADPYISITAEGTGELLVAMLVHDINAWAPTAQTGVQLYDTDHGTFGSGHQYILNPGSNPQTLSWTTTGTGDQTAIALAFKDQAAIVVPTVTTSSPTSVTETGATGQGEITALGGENATRRGFCFMTGTSGDPTTANSVVYTDGSFAAGTFSQSLGTLSPGTNYRVRAYAVNSAGTGYGTTVQLLTHSYPTIAPNTADATDFGSDSTPTLEFTGSDADSDTLQYEIEISNINTFPSAAAITKQNIETDTGTVHANNISGEGTEDDRPGNSFLGMGGILDSIHLKMGIQGTVSGNYYVKIYEIQGTFGTDAEPLNAAAPASTPTPNYIAISDGFAIPGDLTTSGVEKTVTFSGANRIRLLKDHAYYFIVNYVGTGDASNAPFVSVTTAHTYEGDCYNDGQSAANNGYVTAWEVWFKLYEVPVYYGKVSNVDAGFVNTVDGGDTNPFTAGQKVSYTIQTGSELPVTNTYYWHARVKDPSGSNTYSGWTTTRSFTVTVSTGINGSVSQTLSALTLAATGTIDIAGVLSSTLASLSLSSPVTVAVDGTLSSTLADVTLASTATVGADEAFLTLSQTLASLSPSVTGTVAIDALVSQTLAPISPSAAGTVSILGDANPQLAPLTSEAVVAVAIDAQLARTLSSLTAEGVGTVALAASLEQTLSPLTSAAAGTISLSGTLAQTLAFLSLTATGIVEDIASALAVVDQTLASLSLSSQSTVGVSGVLSSTLAHVLPTASGTAIISGSTSKTLTDLTSQSTGTVAIAAVTSSTLAPLTLEAIATLDTITAIGELAQTLGQLTAIATGTNQVSGQLSAVLDSLAVASGGTVSVNGAVARTLSPMTSVGSGTISLAGVLSRTLDALTLASDGSVAFPGALGELIATLAPLSGVAVGQIQISATVNITLSELQGSGSAESEIHGSASILLALLTVLATGHIAADRLYVGVKGNVSGAAQQGTTIYSKKPTVIITGGSKSATIEGRTMKGDIE